MQDDPSGSRAVDPAQVRPADHLRRPPGAAWAYWKRLMLRSAGFPAELVLGLASPECAAAADRALEEEGRAAAAGHAALEQIRRSLDTLRAQGLWDDEEQRKPMLSVQRSLAKGNTARARELAPSLSDQPARAALATLAHAETACAAALKAFEDAYEDALSRQSETLQQIVSRDDFQEAVIWQNRGAFGRAVEKLEGRPGAARTHRQRRREELAANYLQRYCVKNDTIGFFGPTAWGRFQDDGSPLTCRPGPRLLARRETYLEDWGLAELSRALLERHRGLRIWLRPRRLPSVALHENNLYRPNRPPEQISPQTATLLVACDGQRTARQLAAELSAHPRRGFGSEDDVYRMLDELQHQATIAWDFEIPIGPHAQEAMRRQIEAIGDEVLRRLALDALGELEKSRSAIADSGGDAGRLNRAIGDLEDTFTRLTGTPATRKPGQTYGGRTLVYEECLRDLELDIGPRLAAEIETPLNLLLASARWCMADTTKNALELFQQIYAGLKEELRTPLVHLGHFWQRVAPCLLGDKKAELQNAIPELQKRWRQILSADPSARRVELSSAELAPRVAAAFAIPDSFVPLSLYHSPDLMISAPSQEAIRQGDYEIVLGEWHPGRNTLNVWVFMTLAPDREELFACIDRDLPDPLVVPMPPRDNPRITTRTHRAHLSSKDLFLTPPDGGVIIPPDKTILMSSMLVEDTREGLIVRTFEGSQRFGILHFFTEFLLINVVNSFKLLGTADHWPRITIDRLIVQREAWSFPAGAMRFAEAGDSGDAGGRFLAARRWAREHGIPRFVFAKTPCEEKPFYVDFESPIYVEILSKAIHLSREMPESTITLSEMVPAPDRLWLEDAQGQKYTSELRMVVVDQIQRFGPTA